MRKMAFVPVVFGLSACGTPPATYSAPPPSQQAAVAPQALLPRTDRGFGGIIGQDASSLKAMLGQTRIDLTEGDARKLQFASASCVLDIYLYPSQARGEPLASHVVARARSGGAPVDETACLNEIAAR